MTDFHTKIDKYYYEVKRNDLFFAYKTARAKDWEAIELAFLLKCDLDLHEGTPVGYIEDSETTDAQALAIFWRMQPDYWISRRGEVDDFQQFESHYFELLFRQLENGFYKTSTLEFDPLQHFKSLFREEELTLIPQRFKEKMEGRAVDLETTYTVGSGGYPIEVALIDWLFNMELGYSAEQEEYEIRSPEFRDLVLATFSGKPSPFGKRSFNVEAWPELSGQPLFPEWHSLDPDIWLLINLTLHLFQTEHSYTRLN